ncbi:MAG: type II toxin-antitoxin system RelE/ParE family toxin [Rhizobiaceae bacterium]
MIGSFRNKALKRLWGNNDERGINPQHLAKVGRILAALDDAVRPEDMNLPGYRLHKLQGDHPPRWSVWVNGNWRITFSIVDGHAIEVDYEDYH